MRKVCSLSAIVLVAGATIAAAQGPDLGKPGKGGGGDRGGQPGPAAGQRSGSPSPRASQPPPRPHPAVRVPERAPAARQVERPRAVERPRTVEPRASEQRRAEGGREQRRAAEERRAQERRQAPERQRANERRAAEQRSAAERTRAEERRASEQRAGQQKKGGERLLEAQRPGTSETAAGKRVTAKHERLGQARATLSEDQRTRLRRSFTVSRDRISRVHFTKRIGTRIPRNVRLFAIPAAAFSIFPYYRDYRYVVLEDTICIVDPETYEIVDVLDEAPYAPGPRPQVAELTLTERERRLVLDSIPPDFPQIDLRLRLALGAEIPQAVGLHEFAPLVLHRIPKLRDYRFVLARDELVIVAPWDRSIALILDR
jgi:uncharacterized protein DUF1236